MEAGPVSDTRRSERVLQYDWENSVGYWIVNTAHAVRRALNTELAREGITLRQWEVLACLALNEEMSQAEVAERLGIEAPTLVGILDRMERDGWLERINCAHDRRKKRIRGTKKSEQLWARMVGCAHRVRARAISGVTTAEIDAFRSVCTRILTNLDSRRWLTRSSTWSRPPSWKPPAPRLRLPPRILRMGSRRSAFPA
jgi:DNA-binding MarR family transcriptional regulator